MQPVKCLVLLCAGFLAMLALANTSHGIYFIMKLKNGNELKTDYYSKDNGTTKCCGPTLKAASDDPDASMIRFYTNEGAVVIPKSIIETIQSDDGRITDELVDSEKDRQQVQEVTGEDEYGEKEPGEAAQGKKRSNERLESIKDQLAVIEANLESLDKNKSIYLTQKAQYEQQMQKSQERIDKLKKGPDADLRGVKEEIELEQGKLKEIDVKLNDMQDRIQNSDKQIEAQQRIKQRFAADLARLKK